MSLRALLLSPDDQAIHAITSVLEEMSVSCDRPLDGATAAKKLNSEHFDLVVVDCDNLPAAKLIFDVCRRSHGATSVPVAVVDGRVGLPTAFRLGAELILTKPVAKDQARLTIRTAVSRTKKDQPAQEAKPADSPSAVGVEKQENTVEKALAAAAGAASSGSAQTSLAAAEPIFAAAPATTKAETRAASVAIETISTMKSSAAAEVATPMPPVLSKPVLPATTAIDHSEKQTALAPATPVAAFEQQPSEDPVLAALENEESQQQSPAPASCEEPRPDRSRRLFAATLLLAVLAGGGYAGWMYQPGFRKFIELRIEQGKTLLGWQRSTSVVRPPAPAPAAKQPVAQQPAPQVVSSPAPQNSIADAPSNTNNALAVPPIPTTNTPVAATSANVDGAPSVAAPDTSSNSAATEPEKKIAEPAAPAGDFPEAKNAVILSSKGAEKRLLHRVKPVVPAELRAQSSEATVVLKALIDENGVVKALQPVEGNAIVAGPAMKAVKQWRYQPYTRNGKSLPFQTIVLVDLQ